MIVGHEREAFKVLAFLFPGRSGTIRIATALWMAVSFWLVVAPAQARTLRDTVTGTTSVTTTPPHRFYVAQEIRRVAVLPFSDHSHQESFVDALSWGGNYQLTAAMVDALLAQGFDVSSLKDVGDALLQEKVIREIKGARNSNTLGWELINAKHNPHLTKQLTHRVQQEVGGSTPLTVEQVRRIGNKLGVDAVMRGVIYERHFEWTQEPHVVQDKFNGLVPFLFGSLIDGVAAYATAETYESGLSLADDDGGFDIVASVPGSEKGGKVTLVVGLYLQNARTGQVSWRGKGQLQYDIDTFAASHQELIRLLVNDLFSRMFLYKGYFLHIKEIQP